MSYPEGYKDSYFFKDWDVKRPWDFEYSGDPACPFCGGEPECQSEDQEQDDVWTIFHIVCKDCGSCGAWGRTEGDAWRFWQSRDGILADTDPDYDDDDEDEEDE